MKTKTITIDEKDLKTLVLILEQTVEVHPVDDPLLAMEIRRQMKDDSK